MGFLKKFLVYNDYNFFEGNKINNFFFVRIDKYSKKIQN